MKQVFAISVVALGVALAPLTLNAAPADDLKAFQDFFKKKFANVPMKEFGNGAYGIDPKSRAEWQAIEEFPPYETGIDNGKQLWSTPFANGKTYADCLGKDVKAIRPKYPHFDVKAGKVATLEAALNNCRVSNGEKAFEDKDYKSGPLVDITAYLAKEARGQKINVTVPNDPKALEAYEKGKQHFWAKRGQLNLACSDCHVNNAGGMIRADMLSPALGQASHWPVYRSAWGYLGSLQERYKGCNEQVRAKGFKYQSDEYNNLELYHTYMSNGVDYNGPAARK